MRASGVIWAGSMKSRGGFEDSGANWTFGAVDFTVSSAFSGPLAAVFVRVFAILYRCS